MPEILEKIITSMKAGSISDFNKEVEWRHAHQRVNTTKYSLDQFIQEYDLLWKIIFEVMESQCELNTRQIKKIIDSIFTSIKEASSEFIKIREHALNNLYQEKFTNFNLIINAVEDYAIFTLDSFGVIQTWNAGAERMKKYSSDEAVGQHFSMLYPDEGRMRNEPMDHLKTARVEGRYRGEGVRVKKNGEKFLADVYIIPIYEKKEIVGFAKIIQNISERQKLLQERDISQIETANLKKQYETRETFISTLTHDLRNPLTAAKTSAQLILRSPNDKDKIIKLASKIIDQVNRTDKLISNLLDANKVRFGEVLNLQKVDCSILKIINDIVHEQSEIYGKRIEIISHGDFKGHWDCDGLRRVMENLISNAIKYGEEQKPVSVSIIRRDNRVIVKVHNFGKPIEISDQLLLFKKFQRSQSAKEQGIEGWGLGLTVVKGIVEAHEGTVKVESYPIEGTTFTIDFPIDSRLDHVA